MFYKCDAFIKERKEDIMSKELSKTYDPKDIEDRLYKLSLIHI